MNPAVNTCVLRVMRASLYGQSKELRRLRVFDMERHQQGYPQMFAVDYPESNPSAYPDTLTPLLLTSPKAAFQWSKPGLLPSLISRSFDGREEAAHNASAVPSPDTTTAERNVLVQRR